MVEDQACAGNKRQVGGDVALGDFDLAILHVFGMDELDFVDHVEFIE